VQEIPNFVTDIFGAFLLIPLTRAPGSAGRSGPTGPTTSSRHYDYDGTAEEIDADDPWLTG
jgi:UPF0716 family protein affecting phage T7 exclusion